MISRLLRLIVRMAVLAALVWAVRAALKTKTEGSGDGWAPAAPAPTSAAEEVTAPTKKDAASNGAWVKPDPTGAAPSTHPVKAKVASKLYRVPGMADYERVRADRCYESAEAAEADGFSRARR